MFVGIYNETIKDDNTLEVHFELGDGMWRVLCVEEEEGVMTVKIWPSESLSEHFFEECKVICQSEVSASDRVALPTVFLEYMGEDKAVQIVGSGYYVEVLKTEDFDAMIDEVNKEFDKLFENADGINL